MVSASPGWSNKGASKAILTYSLPVGYQPMMRPWLRQAPFLTIVFSRLLRATSNGVRVFKQFGSLRVARLNESCRCTNSFLARMYVLRLTSIKRTDDIRRRHSDRRLRRTRKLLFSRRHAPRLPLVGQRTATGDVSRAGDRHVRDDRLSIYLIVPLTSRRSSNSPANTPQPASAGCAWFS
jgi:hypothetical protein